MDVMEIRERLKFFNRLLRIPELNVDNITIEDLNSINSVLAAIEIDQQNSFIPTGFLMNTMRILKEASERSQIDLNMNLERIDRLNVIQYLQNAVNYLIDYKTNNPTP